MRLLIERVQQASVQVDQHVCGSIGCGLLVYVACVPGDQRLSMTRVADRIARIRIFPDAHQHLNRSPLDDGRALLLIPAITLVADCQRGHRPSLSPAAAPSEAQACFEALATACRQTGLEVATGRFGHSMAVAAVNDGPVTCIVDLHPEPLRRPNST